MSDGSYVIGGGDWGQNVNETLLTQLIGAAPTPTDPFGQIATHLLRMPLDALRVFEPFIPGAKSTDFGTQQSAVETIMSLMTTNPLNQAIQDAVNDLINKIKEIIDSIVGGWQGNTDGVWDPFNIFATMEQINDAISSLNLQVSEYFAGGTDGVSVSENFTLYPDGGPGAKWLTWHKGTAVETIEVKDGKLWLFCFPLATRSGWAKCVAEDTGTDFQRVGVVFGSKPQTGLFNQTAYNYIMGRVSAAGTTEATATFVFAKLGANSAEIGVNIRGTETIFKKATTFNFNPAASYTLQCGVKGTGGAADAPYTFRLYDGNTQILEAVDTGRVSLVGAAHRNTGLAFSNASALQSGKVASFVMFDSK